MRPTTRALLRWLAALVAALVGVAVWDMARPTPPLPCDLGLLLGAVEASSAVVWTHACAEALRSEAAAAAVLHVREMSDAWAPKAWTLELAAAATATTIEGGARVAAVRLTGLKPNTKYEARFLNDTVAFTTFPSAEYKSADDATLTFTHGSCAAVMLPPYHTLEAGFRAMARQDPRFVMLLGDNVYTDLAEWWFGLYLGWYRVPFEAAHRRVLLDPAVRDLLHSRPSFAMLDDHEVVNDFFGPEKHALMDEGVRHFQTYWGSRNPLPSRNGLWYTFDYGRLATFFVADCRSHFDLAKGTMFGAAQRAEIEAWLERGLRLGFDFIVLASPLSWSDDGHGTLFTKEREELLDVMSAKLKLRNVVIVSGDMHFGSAYKYRNGTVLELSASPFQGIPFWPDVGNGANHGAGYERVMIRGTAFHFGKISLRRSASPSKSTLTWELFSWPLLAPLAEPKVVFTLEHHVSSS